MTLSVEQDLPTATAAAPAERRKRQSRFRRSLRRYWQLYLLLLIPIIWFIVFRYIPMANAVPPSRPCPSPTA